MDAIEQIRQAQAEAKLKASADLLLLADKLAKGERPPADVLDILAKAGATADQLAGLTGIAKERLSLEPRAAAFEQVLADRAKADAELAAAVEVVNDDLKKAHEKAEAKLAPLRAKVATLAEAERDSRYAKQRLHTLTAARSKAEGKPDPNTVAGAVALADQIEEE